jgi:tetratricopeptide (TPR) repeat protein
MAETARILRFPARRVTPSPQPLESAATRARAFLGTPREERHDEFNNATLADGDVLMSVCGALWDSMNSTPTDVSLDASSLYAWVSSRSANQFFFDERDFFLGETALLAAASLRLLGKRDQTERWLERADAGFRHTVAPAAHLARVAYIRLTLRYDMRHHEDGLELLPSVALTFERLGMHNDLAKCYFLEAMSLKELGRFAEAQGRFEELISNKQGWVDAAIQGFALVNIGDLHSEGRRFDAALSAYAEALPLLKTANRPVAIADLKLMVASTMRSMGKLVASIDAYRESIHDYEVVGSTTRAAYVRVLLAEALLEAGRCRDAEWQVNTAMTTINEEEMVPEGMAAFVLLKETVRQRKMNPVALAEVRQYLQTKI